MKNMEIFEKVASRKITAEEGADLMMSNDKSSFKTDLSDTIILLIIIIVIASFLR